MKIIFAQTEMRISFGISQLSAVIKQRTRADVGICITETRHPHECAEEIIAAQPTVLALAACTTEEPHLLHIAQIVKKAIPELCVLMGGSHPTFFPQVIEEEAILDAICRGEGEEAVCDLLQALVHNNDISAIPNLWVRQNGTVIKNEVRNFVSLEKLPMPDHALFYDAYTNLADEPTKKFMVSRGCPYNCTYCFNQPLKELYRGKGTYCRRKSVAQAIAEIKAVRDTYGMQWAQFQDDMFNANKDYLYEFLDAYKKEIGLGFLCLLRVDNVDEEMVRRLKDAGLEKAHIGIEIGDMAVREDLLNRHMTNQKIIEVGKLLNKYGIRVWTFNMIGFPNESVAMVRETIEVNRAFTVEYASCSIMQPYPGTELCRRLKEDGHLAPSFDVRSIKAPYVDHSGDAIGTSLTCPMAQYSARFSVCFNFLVHHYWAFSPLAWVLKSKYWRVFAVLNYISLMRVYIHYAGNFSAKLKETLLHVKKIGHIIKQGFQTV